MGGTIPTKPFFSKTDWGQELGIFAYSIGPPSILAFAIINFLLIKRGLKSTEISFGYILPEL